MSSKGKGVAMDSERSGNFWYNADTGVVSEVLDDDNRLKLEIIDGKRVKTPGKMFWGAHENMSPLRNEEVAWSFVESEAAFNASAAPAKAASIPA